MFITKIFLKLQLLLRAKDDKCLMTATHITLRQCSTTTTIITIRLLQVKIAPTKRAEKRNEEVDKYDERWPLEGNGRRMLQVGAYTCGR